MKSIRQIEKRNEARIIFYIKLVAGSTVGLLLMLTVKEGILSTASMQLLIFISVSFFLFAGGSILFFYNTRQIIIKTSYESSLKHIKSLFEENGFLEKYSYNDREEVNAYLNEFEKHQALYAIAIINSFIAALFFNLILISVLNFSEMTVKKILILALLTFLSFFLFHCSYIRIKSKIMSKPGNSKKK